MKKVSHFVIALIMAVAMVFPMVPKSVNAQSMSTSDRAFVDQLNAIIAAFNVSCNNAELVLGPQRLTFFTGTSLGIPVSQLELQRQMFGVPTNVFIEAHIIGQAAGVPGTRILEMFRTNPDFGRIALALNTP